MIKFFPGDNSERCPVCCSLNSKSCSENILECCECGTHFYRGEYDEVFEDSFISKDPIHTGFHRS